MAARAAASATNTRCTNASFILPLVGTLPDLSHPRVRSCARDTMIAKLDEVEVETNHTHSEIWVEYHQWDFQPHRVIRLVRAKSLRILGRECVLTLTTPAAIVNGADPPAQRQHRRRACIRQSQRSHSECLESCADEQLALRERDAAGKVGAAKRVPRPQWSKDCRGQCGGHRVALQSASG